MNLLSFCDTKSRISARISLAFIFLVSACDFSNNSFLRDSDEIPPEYSEYVTALTSGVVSCESTIKMVLQLIFIKWVSHPKQESIPLP